jgi:hypothetical protein
VQVPFLVIISFHMEKEKKNFILFYFQVPFSSL